MQLSILSINSYINFSRSIFIREDANYVANFCVSKRKPIAKEDILSRNARKRSILPQCLVSVLPKLASPECPVRERLRRNIVSFDVLIAFQIPAANLWWNPRPIHRRAISSNIPPRYLGAPNSTCKLISLSLSLLPTPRYTWPERVAFPPCYPLSGSLIGPGTPL